MEEECVYISPGPKEQVLCKECFNDMSNDELLRWLGMEDEIKHYITLVVDYE